MNAKDWESLRGKLIHVKVLSVVPLAPRSHMIQLEIVETDDYADVEVFEYDEEGQRDAL